MGLYNTHTWHAQPQNHCEKKSRKITVVWWVPKPDNPTPANRTPNENWLGNVSEGTGWAMWAKKLTLEGLPCPGPGKTARSKVQGGQLTQEPTVSRDYQARTQTWAGHRIQKEKDKGPRSKKRGTKGKSQNRDPASLACLTEQMVLLRNCLDTCWKPTDAECDGVPLSVYPDLTFCIILFIVTV